VLSELEDDKIWEIFNAQDDRGTARMQTLLALKNLWVVRKHRLQEMTG